MLHEPMPPTPVSESSVCVNRVERIDKDNHVLSTQIDLIVMEGNPSGPPHHYKYIVHVKDHFSGYSFLRPVTNKKSSTVAEAVSVKFLPTLCAECCGSLQTMCNNHVRRMQGGLPG